MSANSTAANSTATPEICDVGGGGFLLRFGDDIQGSNKSMRAVIFLLCLLYTFKGVGVVADKFMDGVTQIISSKKRVYRNNRWVTYLVWNNTVADLSLLALGSSAPEILLSCIETISSGFFSGELGPSTIVGSAAFNLLVITAVCVSSIPQNAVRAIDNMSVYHATVIFSMFAYIWLLLIVVIITPNVIDIWEALVTLVMFPILLLVCYAANKGKLPWLSLESRPSEEEKYGLVSSSYGRGSCSAASCTEQDAALQISKHPRLTTVAKASVAFRRASRQSIAPSTRGSIAARGSEAGGKLEPAGCNSSKKICDGSSIPSPLRDPGGVISFRKDTTEVKGTSEMQQLEVEVLRYNSFSEEVSCSYHVEGMSAVAGKDFEELGGTLTFASGETSQTVMITILPQRPQEPDDVLQLVLEEAQGDAVFNPNDDGGLSRALLTITICNCQNPPFCEKFWDSDNFKAGLEIWKENILDALTLDEGLEPNGNDDDGEESGPPSAADYLGFIIDFPWSVFFAVICPPSNWGGGWVLFSVSLFWVGSVTALIGDLAGMFGCCAGMSGMVTAITVVALGTSLPDTFASMSAAANDDTADSSIVNVTGSNSVNVFLGIGIPWVIASIYWAVGGDTSAWQTKYGSSDLVVPQYSFVVEAGSLGFSVAIFNCVAVVCLVVLRIRRLKLGGELGGPSIVAKLTSLVFVLLWLTYIGLSIWRDSSKDAEVMQIPMVILAVVVILGGVVFEQIVGRYDPTAAALVTQEKESAAGKTKELAMEKEGMHSIKENKVEHQLVGVSAYTHDGELATAVKPNAQEGPEEEAQAGTPESDMHQLLGEATMEIPSKGVGMAKKKSKKKREESESGSAGMDETGESKNSASVCTQDAENKKKTKKKKVVKKESLPDCPEDPEVKNESLPDCPEDPENDQ